MTLGGHCRPSRSALLAPTASRRRRRSCGGVAPPCNGASPSRKPSDSQYSGSTQLSPLQQGTLPYHGHSAQHHVQLHPIIAAAANGGDDRIAAAAGPFMRRYPSATIAMESGMGNGKAARPYHGHSAP